MAYSYDRRPLYHGTSHNYEKPKLNPRGILWLTPNPVVAAEYATPHYHKGESFVWKFQLKGGAKIVDLSDLSHPVIREVFNSTNESRKYTLGPWTEEDWERHTDFGTLEQFAWLPKFLKSKGIDGVTCRDSISTIGIPHDSVALLKLSAIASMEKQVVTPDGKSKTIGEIQKEVEDWKP
jgi:hypothetical protein